MTHWIFDTEIIGKDKPVFLVCCEHELTGERHSFWGHKKAHRQDFTDLLLDPCNTWVSFNGIKFDAPLITAWLYGHPVTTIKALASTIIEQRLQPWDAYALARVQPLEFDHIDLFEVAPGVRTSLKTYAGRMFYPSMVDLPFHYDKDLTPKEKRVLEQYCFNDLGVTKALFVELREQLELRKQLSEQHDIDLRSKSDAQVAEAILKKTVGLGKAAKRMPLSVRYTAPPFIKTDNPVVLNLIKEIEATEFIIEKNGSPQLPLWLSERTVELGDGLYQVGIGGLHSKHDKQLHDKATDKFLISDFDVASYYPTIMLICGLKPQMAKGEAFLEAYREIYDRRRKAKREGNKAEADALKISLNGTFGKLGSIYCSFYSPDLLLAVTITGQLNLLCLIAELIKIRDVQVLSANTDGVMVGYTPAQRQRVLKVIAANSKRTGFDYEETPYRSIAMKDVNNYLAITTEGKIKAKGLYAKPGLMKNPTMPVCSQAVSAWLKDAVPVEETIRACTNFVDFTAIRNVTGGAEQYGVQLGRVVRWYMSTEALNPIRYTSNGNCVPKTEGARACMILPEQFPPDLDYAWYIREAHDMLADLGVQL